MVGFFEAGSGASRTTRKHTQYKSLVATIGTSRGHASEELVVEISKKILATRDLTSSSLAPPQLIVVT